ncbi:guanitoxin biosynthesis heme-dependent pre-guanitoxin N-hydroxylase GntA [Deinococcus lacus]|uniref:Guanitoxin biosynthesis heme-dependent pre-guanitoxin N-hydroxylase GntA n=1 Tax=Deinococcus lacus TaxID=392561 RepID=A0ABW1YD16_9DEIO
MTASLPDLPALALPGGYFLVAEGGSLQPVRGASHSSLDELHRAFRDKILAPEFSCVAAKASFNTRAYAFAAYAELGTPEAALGLAHDLRRFVGDQDAMGSDFTSLIATFAGPANLTEIEFEARLWQQLRDLHALDTDPYSPEVSPDPTSNNFGFSFAGRGFFIIGLHPGSSRVARQFPAPALVFNAHRQFQRLRDTGRFERMQQTIRARELKLQGSLNPNLANHGEAPEARQYSGRPVEAGWVAPFPTTGGCPLSRQPKPKSEAD